jgi:hypothetical protein
MRDLTGGFETYLLECEAIGPPLVPSIILVSVPEIKKARNLWRAERYRALN